MFLLSADGNDNIQAIFLGTAPGRHGRPDGRQPGQDPATHPVTAHGEIPMTERTIRTALISSDRSFREMVKDVFLSHEAWTAPAIEIAAPFSAFGENELRAVRQLNPDLIILDLADEPELGHQARPFPERVAPRASGSWRWGPTCRPTSCSRPCGRAWWTTCPDR